MKLVEALPNSKIYIKEIHGKKAKKFLKLIGVNNESVVYLLKNNFQGPITIIAKNTKLVIDRSIAKHVDVNYGL